MALRFDLQNIETRLLNEYAGSFKHKSVLEIGSGDGRLTWLFAHQASLVVGIDPNPDKIARAVKETPAELADRVTFKPCTLEEYESDERFDLVILSWSL